MQYECTYSLQHLTKEMIRDFFFMVLVYYRKNKLWKEVADWFIERFIYQEGNEWIVWFDLLITLYSKTTPTCKYFNIIRTWQYNPRPNC